MFNSVTNTRAIAKKAMRGETMRVRNIVNTLKHDGGNAQSEVAVVTLPGRVEEGGRRRVGKRELLDENGRKYRDKVQWPEGNK